MNLLEDQEYEYAVQIGRVLLSDLVFPRLEAFSGNALYSGRGMPTMNKLKSVKEVCALTGLTRKHLYYFHHEKVVQAAAYANYSVEGNDGYKLYDEEAVEKLQQIALYYQLGLKRNEIRDMMRSPGYDRNAVLKDLLDRERAKRRKIDRHIAALEYLQMAGVKNGQAGSYCALSPEELGQTVLNLRSAGDLPAVGTEFEEALMDRIRGLGSVPREELFSDRGNEAIAGLLALGKSQLGDLGIPFLAGLFAGILGEGDLFRGLSCEVTAAHCHAVLRYIENQSEIRRNGK